jgi:hypothetical protein
MFSATGMGRIKTVNFWGFKEIDEGDEAEGGVKNERREFGDCLRRFF